MNDQIPIQFQIFFLLSMKSMLEYFDFYHLQFLTDCYDSIPMHKHFHLLKNEISMNSPKIEKLCIDEFDENIDLTFLFLKNGINVGIFRLLLSFNPISQYQLYPIENKSHFSVN